MTDRRPPAVVVMAKAPRPGLAKTRLHPLLGADGAAALQAALIAHTVTLAAAVAPTFVAVDPPDAQAEVLPLLPAGVPLFGQAPGDLGTRMAAAVLHVAARTGGPVLVVGTDVPTMPAATLRTAADLLTAGADAVLGPALDGGYYLIGLPVPDPAAFALEPGLWGGHQVLAATQAALARAGRTPVLLEPLPDLDTPADAWALLAAPGLPGPIAHLLRTQVGVTAGRGSPLRVSIVVPVLDEAPRLPGLLARLHRDFPGCEVIVVDGGSSDGSPDLVRPPARLVTSPPGRGRQLNAGAAVATGDVLWFQHADTHADPAALDQLRGALADPGVVGGGLTIRFDRPGPALAWVAATSNLRARRLHQVFGDQALFVRRSTFDALGGFPDWPLMEDLEMSRRLARVGRLVVLPATSTASARRFTEHGTLRLLAFMQWLKALYFAGVDPADIARRYAAGPPRLRCGRTRSAPAAPGGRATGHRLTTSNHPAVPGGAAE